MLCHYKSKKYLSEICKNITNSSILSKLRNSSLKWALYKLKIRKPIKSAVTESVGRLSIIALHFPTFIVTFNFWVCGWIPILMCDHSNESYWVVLSCGVVYLTVQGGSNFWVWWNPQVTIQMKATDFPVILSIML